MLNYKDAVKNIGDLKIAFPQGEVDIHPEIKENDKDKSKSFKYYPIINFKIALYKNPFTMMINAYFPMLILALLALMIF